MTGPQASDPSSGTPSRHNDSDHDIVLRDAWVIDGTGRPRGRGDVGIDGDRIAAVGPPRTLSGRRTIDAAGRCLAPGFIDVHTHDDNALLRAPAMTPKTSQGVTTVVTGNCGVSAAPLVLDRPPPPPLDLVGDQAAFRFRDFSDYLQALEAAPAALNAAPMVGHSTLRVGTMEDVAQPANEREIDAMRDLVREALTAGARGFSTGLFYPTNRAAPAAEVMALLQELTGTGAIYATHMRDEADGVEDSLEESFETARQADVPLVISHHKCVGQRNFGRSAATLARIDGARVKQPVGLDLYPYTAGSTVLLPEFVDRASRVLITWSEPHPEAAGRDLADIAGDWGCAAAEAIERLVPAGAIYFMMDEADVRRIMAYPHTMIGSDGLPHDQHPHPRLWGTFPRVLARYVRELGLLSLEEAVHRMTGLSAHTFAIPDRGQIRPGAYADLVLFDAETVQDEATFEDPCRPASGIERVMVNGETVYEAGGSTGARPGRVLRRGR